MNDTLISFPTAKLAKEIGFDEEVINHFRSDGTEFQDKMLPTANIHWGIDCFTRPTQSLLQKYIRETYNIHIYIIPYWNNEEKAKLPNIKPEYSVSWVADWIDEDELIDEYFKTYEEALEKGLYKALMIVKNEKN